MGRYRRLGFAEVTKEAYPDCEYFLHTLPRSILIVQSSQIPRGIRELFIVRETVLVYIVNSNHPYYDPVGCQNSPLAPS